MMSCTKRKNTTAGGDKESTKRQKEVQPSTSQTSATGKKIYENDQITVNNIQDFNVLEEILTKLMM